MPERGTLEAWEEMMLQLEFPLGLAVRPGGVRQEGAGVGGCGRGGTGGGGSTVFSGSNGICSQKRPPRVPVGGPCPVCPQAYPLYISRGWRPSRVAMMMGLMASRCQ